MDSTNRQNQYEPTGGIEKRSRSFYHVGHILTYGILALFLTTFVAAYYTTEFWQRWAFNGTVSMADSCSYRLFDAEMPTKSLPGFQTIQLPHGPGKFLKPPGSLGENLRVEFDCLVPKIEDSAVTYVHFGWVRGDEILVYVEGRLATRMTGTQKLMIPVLGGERIRIHINQRSMAISEAGFVGVQLPSVAAGVSANSNLFGLETLVLITRPLTYLMPILSLGVVLGLAWLGGFRSRNLLMAMYVLLWISAKQFLPILSNLVDIDRSMSTMLAIVLRMGIGISLVLFHMEVSRLRPKIIYPVARSSIVVLSSIVFVNYFFPNLIPISSAFNLSMTLTGISLLTIAFMLRSRKSATDRVVLLASIVFGVLCISDVGSRFLGSNIVVTNVIQVFQPLYVAIFLLFSMSVSDKKYVAQLKDNAVLNQRVDLEIAKATTLSRFLPKTLVDQFTTKKSIEENLDRVLTPRTENIAIIQADLRGFSQLTDKLTQTELIQVLKECFGPVVDNAQQFSMVKLVGDCLFAFIETPADDKSPVDLAVEIAAHLIQQVHKTNAAIFKEPVLKFGIAINYGSCIIGNLSSDNCIDYTALGNPVNLTSRLEELTKNEQVSAYIGMNAVLLSKEAVDQLLFYTSIKPSTLILDRVKVRSFDKVSSVRFFTQEQCNKLVFGDRPLAALNGPNNFTADVDLPVSA